MHRRFHLITSFGHLRQPSIKKSVLRLRVLRRHPDNTVMRRVARDQLGDRNPLPISPSRATCKAIVAPQYSCVKRVYELLTLGPVVGRAPARPL